MFSFLRRNTKTVAQNSKVTHLGPGESEEYELLPISDDAREWIQYHVAFAQELLGPCCPEYAGLQLGPFALDKLSGHWGPTLKVGDEPTRRKLANILGVTFGDYLIRRFDLDWKQFQDAHGSEFVVFGAPGEGDFMMYPIDFVDKRFERQEFIFFESTMPTIEHAYENIKNGRIFENGSQ